MRVACAHWLKCPFDKGATLGKSTLALRPFQLRAHAVILVSRINCHHVRIAKDFASLHRRQMMNEPDKVSFSECAQSPTAGHARYDQMPSRRDFQIRKTKRCPLKIDARIVFFDRVHLANSYDSP